MKPLGLEATLRRHDATWTRVAPRIAPEHASWSGSRRRRTRCSRSSTSPRIAEHRAERRARRSSSTTRSRRRCSSARSSSARPSSCTRRPSTSTVTPTSSAAPSSRATPRSAERLRFLQNAIGGVPSPFDCYLVLRGLKTLARAHAPARRSGAGASPSASSQHPQVERVFYPGLADAPGARARAAPDEGARRDDQLRARRAALAGRAAFLEGARASSRAPRASAASSRWPSTRRS